MVTNLNANVLLVTATDIESETVLQVFERATGRKAQAIRIGDLTYFDLGTVNGARTFLVKSEMGTGGLGGSQETVRKGIEALSPMAVIMVGIAFGVDEAKQAIGDILVSENLLVRQMAVAAWQLRRARLVERPHFTLQACAPHRGTKRQ